MTLTELGEILLPWKEIIGGVVGLLGAIAAGGVAILKQRKKPDSSFTEQQGFARSSTVRLHADDREAVADLREDVTDLTRGLRHVGKLIEANTDAVDRLRGAL